MKVYELSMSLFSQSFLSGFVRFVPRYQVSIYRSIGPLV